MADYMIENKMANDRCWPKPKPITDEEAWDQFERDAKFHTYDWSATTSESEAKSALNEILRAVWRDKECKTDAEKLAEVRNILEGLIEAAFEREAE